MDENNGKPMLDAGAQAEEKEAVKAETPAEVKEPTEVGTGIDAEKKADAPADKVAARKAKVIKEIREWIVALVAAVLIVFVIQSFLFRIIRVDGHSMDTTLADGERLFVTVTDVKFGDVERDSVVICHYPNRYTTYLGFIKTQTYFVKRVVAVPGDTIYCENGVTHVVYEKDGETIDEVLDERFALPVASVYDYEAYTLGEDEYFVVGDNRYNSHDSRDWNGPDAVGGGNDGSESNNVGPISKKAIVGRVREVIWPLGSIRSVK